MDISFKQMFIVSVLLKKITDKGYDAFLFEAKRTSCDALYDNFADNWVMLSSLLVTNIDIHLTRSLLVCNNFVH